MPMRAAARTVSTSLKPSFTFPSRFSFGTRMSSKCSAAVSDERTPSFFSSLPTTSPGVSRSTTNAEMPLVPCDGSVDAMMT